jgi:hypothetical protein
MNVQSQFSHTQEFGECMADNNVGSCQVFHVTALAMDGSHPYDSYIGIEVDDRSVRRVNITEELF